MRFIILVSVWLATNLLSASAQEAPPPLERPRVAPVPDWVKQLPLPLRPAPEDDAAAQRLLRNLQSEMVPNDHKDYFRFATKIADTRALTDYGHISLSWKPEHQDLIIHFVRIHRNGEVIDLLGNGESVEVFRREKKLERAMLDGRLTASFQIDDLRVGDVVDYAYTRSGRDPAFGDSLEDGWWISSSKHTARRYIRVTWPEDVDMQIAVHGSDLTLEAQIRDGHRLLEFDQRDTEIFNPPPKAPERFRRGPYFELSSNPNWGVVSQRVYELFEPQYAVSADSEIKVLAQNILREHSAPSARISAALNLVQSEVRYLALSMGDGGYIPMHAEEVWRRRLGDCKGKTVLLLALLTELGVDAEAVLVHTNRGDGMEERLPRMSLFNHVLVRVQLDGEDYWLDGTHPPNSSSLDDLETPYRLKWGLPLTKAGAQLAPINPERLERPLEERIVKINVPEIGAPSATFEMTATLRGELGDAWRNYLLEKGRAGFRKTILEGPYSLNVSSLKPEDIEIIDQGTEAFVFKVQGEVDLVWRLNEAVGKCELISPHYLYPEVRRRKKDENTPVSQSAQQWTLRRTEFEMPRDEFEPIWPSYEINFDEMEAKTSHQKDGRILSFTAEKHRLTTEMSAETHRRIYAAERASSLMPFIIRSTAPARLTASPDADMEATSPCGPDR